MNHNENLVTVGDPYFSVKIDLEKHRTNKNYKLLDQEIIDKLGEISPYVAQELQSYVGYPAQITDIYRKNGYLCGYRILIPSVGQEFVVHVKDVYVKQKLIENPYVFHSQTLLIKEKLEPWRLTRNFLRYDRFIELCMWDIMKHVQSFVIENGSWIHSELSKKQYPDIYVNRIIVPINKEYNHYAVVILYFNHFHYCTSISLDVFDTTDISVNNLEFYDHDNIWLRTAYASIRLIENKIATAPQAYPNFNKYLLELKDNFQIAKNNYEKFKEYYNIAMDVCAANNIQSPFMAKPVTLAVSYAFLKPNEEVSYWSSDSYHAHMVCVSPNLFKTNNPTDLLREVVIFSILQKPFRDPSIIQSDIYRVLRSSLKS